MASTARTTQQKKKKIPSNEGFSFRSPTCHFVSTPFEAELYDDDDEENPYGPSSPGTNDKTKDDWLKEHPLAVADETTRLVVGLNKYSHDTCICVAHAETGEVLYAQSKERIGSRHKHAAGSVTELVETCLDALQLDMENIDQVIVNNHHYRVLPRERDVSQLEWEAGLLVNQGPDDERDGFLTEPENLFPHVSSHYELSHHLAHAYSVAAQAPFDRGLVVVMDGMGETYRAMMQAVQDQDPQYVCDFNLPQHDTAQSTMQLIPSNLEELAQSTCFDWREAESVYTFVKSNSTTTDPDDTPRAIVDIQPIFKRFTQEHVPPVLYNHGFDSMDSLGALYSRTSSHIFGDWNACGKVMGMAPWAAAETQWAQDPPMAQTVQPPTLLQPIVSGSLYRDDALVIDRTLLKGLPLCARNDPDLFQPHNVGSNDDDEETVPQRRNPYDFDRPDVVPDYTGAADDNNQDMTNPVSGDDNEENDDNNNQPRLPPTRVALEAMALAHRMQTDLETVAMDFIRHFQEQTGQDNLCLAGGVALNSVLNGRVALELQQQGPEDATQKRQLFVPPYPGDDGIAVGCCAYGLFGRRTPAMQKEEEQRTSALPKDGDELNSSTRDSPPLWKGPLSPYLGGLYSHAEIQEALDRASPWIEVEMVRDEYVRHSRMVDELMSGGVIAWFHSRSEVGPRALGHRSILADPRKHGLVRFINQHVKQRETFRPFAPSVLAEQAHEWFDGISPPTLAGTTASPYMSLTAQVKETQRHKIPAVTHIDGSSRLQTVTSTDEPSYHALITEFWKRTGIPMVLNTSFNTLRREPIVETPMEAIRSFLYTKGNLDMLVMEDYIIKRKPADLRKLLGNDVGSRTTLSSSTLGRPVVEPAYPQRVGAAHFQARFSLPEADMDDNDEDDYYDDMNSNLATTWVQMPGRILHLPDKSHGNNPESSPSWYELMDELEGEILSACDGTRTFNEILVRYAAVPSATTTPGDDDDETKKNKKKKREDGVDEETQQVVQNVVHRLVRLYDETFVYW